jgi:hypothetical protein
MRGVSIGERQIGMLVLLNETAYEVAWGNA